MPPDAVSYTREDLLDIAALAAVGRAERVGRQRQIRAVVGEGATVADDARLRRLVERCLLVAAPRSAVGFQVGMIGLARLHRFVRSPVGSARGAAHLGEECALRRVVLDVIDAPDRDEIVALACADLVALRDGVLSCAFAETCRSGACPLAAAASVEEIDLALVWLAGADGAEGRA